MKTTQEKLKKRITFTIFSNISSLPDEFYFVINSYVIFRDNNFLLLPYTFRFVLNTYLIRLLDPPVKDTRTRRSKKKKKGGEGGGRKNKTKHNAQTQAILFLSTLRKRYCSTRLERSEVFQIDRNLIPFEQNFHSITVSLATL